MTDRVARLKTKVSCHDRQGGTIKNQGLLSRQTGWHALKPSPPVTTDRVARMKPRHPVTTDRVAPLKTVASCHDRQGGTLKN